MKQITDFEDLWERFCIMTIDGNLSDKAVLDILKPLTTDRLYKQLNDELLRLVF